MRSLILLAMLFCPVVAHAADGDLVFEAGTSSHVATQVTLSSTTPVLLMISTSVADRSVIDPVNNFITSKIQWYSFTFWNQTTSSGVYKFTDYGVQGGPDIPPTDMDCDVGANIIPKGTEGSPAIITESMIGFKVWGLGCNDTPFSVGLTQRGR